MILALLAQFALFDARVTEAARAYQIPKPRIEVFATHEITPEPGYPQPWAFTVADRGEPVIWVDRRVLMTGESFPDALTWLAYHEVAHVKREDHKRMEAWKAMSRAQRDAEHEGVEDLAKRALGKRLYRIVVDSAATMARRFFPN
jgi:hypothetical protein